ncbi:MAG: hypothetical protein ABI577_11630 [bacterium]
MPTYLITFTTYGTRLHGDERGTVDRRSARVGTPRLAPNEGRAFVARHAMAGETLTLSTMQRVCAEAAIKELGARRHWNLWALNVRTNHVHVVVSAEEAPEIVMQGMKAWVTRALRESGLAGEAERIWTRHGSTRWLNTDASLAAAVDYVLFQQ